MENWTLTVCVYTFNLMSMLIVNVTVMLFDGLNTTTNNNRSPLRLNTTTTNNRSPLRNCRPTAFGHVVYSSRAFAVAI